MSNRVTRIDAKLFTTSFQKYRQAIETQSRYVVYFGGADSSKSYSSHQFELFFLMRTDVQGDTLVIRKVSADHENSTFKLFKDLIHKYGLSSRFTFCNSASKREIECLTSGRKFVFKGVNDVSQLKSIYGFPRIFIEEADQINFDDFKELNRRARGGKVQIIFVLNPVSEDSFINEHIIKGAYKEKTVVVHVTYKDNEFIDQDRIEELERLRQVSEYDYDVYVLGRWGIIRSKDPYIFGFDRLVNVGKPTFNKREVIFASFDYNVGNSCTIQQLYEYGPQKWRITVLKEYKFDGGSGSDLEMLCKQVAIDWGESEIHFTGDASGNNESALTEASKGANLLVFGYLKKYIMQYWKHERVFFKKYPSNPKTALSGWIMSFLMKVLGADFLISESCQILIADIMKAKKLPGGSLNKADANINDYGHVMDCLRYFVHAFCYDLWVEMSRGIAIPRHLQIEE